MENCRRGVLFLVLSVFFIASGVSAHAETVEEKKAAANYDETLPAAEEAQAIEKVSSEPASASVGTVPSPAVPIAAPAPSPETVQPLPAASQGVSKDMPGGQEAAVSNTSGLVEVSGYKYPVFLFVPKDYKTDRTYAMIMIAPAESAKAEKQIEYLEGLAQRKSVFILAP